MFSVAMSFTTPLFRRASYRSSISRSYRSFPFYQYNQQRIEHCPRRYHPLSLNPNQPSSFLGSSLLALAATLLFYQIFGKTSSSEAEEVNRQESLAQAIMDGDTDCAEQIFRAIMHDSNLLYVKDDKGRNYLHLAIIQGREEIVDFLLEKGLFNLDGDLDDQGLNVLHWAIHEGHASIIKKLLNSGATLTIPSKGDKPNECIFPLEMAVAAGRPAIFDLLLQEDKSHQINPLHESSVGNLLHIAIQANQNEMLEYLLTKQIDRVKPLLEGADHHSRTPLQLAAHLGDCKAIQLLITKGKVEINRGNGEHGGTAVHYAAAGHHAEAIQMLDYYNAALLAVDAEGRAPVALIGNQPEAIQCKNLLINFSKIQDRAKTLPPNFNKRPPYNLVFQGGGPRGIAYVGALREMEEKNALCELQRVAGASAGAITAALVAVGYTAEEIENKLKVLDFKDLLDVSEENKGALDRLLRNPTPQQTAKTAISQVMQDYWQAIKKDPIHPWKAADHLVKEYQRIQGLCPGEKLRQVVEEMIREKTGHSYMTFGELRQKVKQDPKQFKHLYVVATRLTHDQTSAIDTFSSEEISGSSPQYDDLIISDAVRASASIPGVFVPHVLHYKDPINGRYSRGSNTIKYIDGGILKNNPLEMFDDKKYQEDPYHHGAATNRRTLGFSLIETPEETNPLLSEPKPQELQTGFDVAKAFLLTYYHAEEIIRNHQGSTDRTIAIPVKLDLIKSFYATPEEIQEMIVSGKEQTGFFLSK